MKKFNKTDYAINKNRKGVVYRNADGSILEITFEKITEGNPEFTKEDFKKLKEFSDLLYLEELRADKRYRYYVIGSYDCISDSIWASTDSLEDKFFEEYKELPTIDAVKEIVEKHFTKIQKRRFYMYMEGLSTIKIAEIEGCNQNAVWESLKLAIKKLKKFL